MIPPKTAEEQTLYTQLFINLNKLVPYKDDLSQHRKSHLKYMQELARYNIMQEERRVKECFETAFETAILDRHPEPRGICPVCLEALSWNAVVESFTCCGNLVCKPCAEDNRSKQSTFADMSSCFYRCPFCREVAAFTDEQNYSNLRKHAAAGRRWAYDDLFQHFLQLGNFPDAIYWLKQAGDTPSALNTLCSLHYHSHDPKFGIEKSIDKAIECGLLSAYKGLNLGLYQVARLYDVKKDKEKNLFFLTLAAGKGVVEAQRDLSLVFNGPTGTNINPHVGLYWLKRAIYLGLDKQEDRFGLNTLGTRSGVATTLIQTGRSDRLRIGTLSTFHREPFTPELMYWMQQEDPSARDDNFIDRIRKAAASECANCYKNASSLLRCSGCKVLNYCDPACQRAHWKVCHKVTCFNDSKMQKEREKVQQDLKESPWFS